MSSDAIVTEPIEVGGYKIRADHPFSINMWYLSHNPDEWFEPSQFIPERFDPKH